MQSKFIKGISLLALLGCVVFLFIYGFRIEIFLFTTILLILGFYFNTLKSDPSKIKSYGSLLLIATFTLGICALKHAVQPGGNQPYFNNTQHHAIQNTGISYRDNLALAAPEGEPSIYTCDRGSVTLKGDELNISNYAEPIFKESYKEGRKSIYTPLYNLFSKPIRSGDIIANNQSKLTVLKCELKDDANFIQRLSNKKKYKLDLQLIYRTQEMLSDTNNEAIEITDTFRYRGSFTKGMQLKELILRAGREHPEDAADAPSAGILHSLGSLSDALVLFNQEKGKDPYVTFFPQKTFEDEGFQFIQSGNVSALEKIQSHKITPEQQIFIGFYNIEDSWSLTKENDNYTLSFNFSPPKYFSLPMTDAHIGQGGSLFIANHYSQMMKYGRSAGFLMSERFKDHPQTRINAQLFYKIGTPNSALQLQLHDGNSQSLTPIQDLKFSTIAQDGTTKWNYKIIDFSKNIYALHRQWIYALCLLILCVLTLQFNPGLRLERIEAPIYAIILAMMMVRHLLLWRLLTFPPVSNIRKTEFISLFGFDEIKRFHIPVGFALIIGFMILLNIYRWLMRKDNFSNPIPVLPKLFAEHKNPFVNKHKELILHLIILIVSALIFTLIPIEWLKRISAIIIPIISYFICSYSLFFREQHEIEYKYSETKQDWLKPVDHFLHHWIETPHFFLSLATIVYYAKFDRGFGIMFVLFLLFKNIVFSFLRRPYRNEQKTLKELFFNPQNYWLYSILFTILYCIVIGVKQTFYYLLLFKIPLLGLILLLTGIYVYLKKYKSSNVISILLAVLSLICFIPPSARFLDKSVNEELKYVRYRAPILFTPVEKIIADIPYNSFEENKVIETAESQWFINSYLQKKIDLKKGINLQPHFNRGVDYITQTRDVVLPRFVIAELGKPSMIALLILLGLPAMLFFTSYRIEDGSGNKINLISSTYQQGVACLLLLTLAFFVWLTSTNRFVFFGQDYPFLSLTSKVSTVLPLVLFWIILSNKPIYREIKRDKVFKRTYLLVCLVTLVVIISGGSKILNKEWFSVRMNRTEDRINNQLNAILASLQVEDQELFMSNQNNAASSKKFLSRYDELMRELVQSPSYQELLNGSDVYTKSILELLKDNPRIALKTSSPIFIKYDNEQFVAEYNKNFYLELPATDQNKSWYGSIVSEAVEPNNLIVDDVSLKATTSPVYYGKYDCHFVGLPDSWLPKGYTKSFLVSMDNSAARMGNESASGNIISTEKGKIKYMDVSTYAQAFSHSDLGNIYTTQGNINFGGRATSDHTFAYNTWVNGGWRLIYPKGKDFFWISHYAQAAKQAYSKAELLDKNTQITLDPKLQNTVQAYLSDLLKNNTAYRSRLDFSVSAIAMDGRGNIKLMADIVNNRKQLDPNNLQAIQKLQQDNYFFSSTRNERDQWANCNLIQMREGPGSSIKPITFAAVASDVNAGWQNMNLQASNKFVNLPYTKRASIPSYAGLNLGKKPWAEQHSGDNSNCNPIEFIEKSNNFYHSLILFLGSYPKSQFRKDSSLSLAHALTNAPNKNNIYPRIELNKTTYSLQNYPNGWPKSGTTFFGNEQSIISHSLSTNYNLATHDLDKEDTRLRTQTRIAFADDVIYDSLRQKGTEAFLYAFPEESYFLQKERTASEPLLNTLVGLRNPTAGGAPWEVSPLKMAEMYARLATQKNITAQIAPKKVKHQSLYVDSSWNGRYNDFLKTVIFNGMKKVLISGTARDLSAKMGMRNGTYKGYHIYAKTGTIGNEGAKYQSKRLAVIISKVDLEQEGPSDQVYILYLSGQAINTANNEIYSKIIDAIIESDDFKKYMNP